MARLPRGIALFFAVYFLQGMVFYSPVGRIKKEGRLWAALIKQYRNVFGKRRSFGYAVSPFCRPFSKDVGSIPIRS